MDGDGASSDVEGVIITGDLDRRPSRAPGYEAESRALASLAEAMSTDPAAVLQRLVEAVIELTGCDSAGISLLEPSGEQGTFRWAATAGAWAPYRDGTMPREQSPCGEVIAREAVVLVKEPERAFPALLQAEPGIGEGLLAPFSIDGAPAGTVWAIMHSAEGRFEAEDARLLKSLARFASAAHQMTLALSGARASEQQIEARYRALFDTIDEGFVELEMVMGDAGQVVDWRWIDFNPAFERISGLKGKKGQLFSEIVPELEPEWAERYGHVIATGEALRFELPVSGLDSWFDAYVSRLGGEGSRRLVVIFNNITARKHAEAALRDSEARQAFLLKLSDALRAEPSADAAADRAIRMLSDQMALDRCYLATFRIDDDRADITHQTGNDRTPPMPATLRISDFPEAFRRFHEQTLVVEDLPGDRSMSDADRQNMLDLGFGAVLVPALRKGARWALVAVSARPRRWTSNEIALVEEVSERAWAAVERAHAEAALRESEARLAAAFESVSVGAAVVDLTGSAVVANAAYRRFLPTGVIPSRDPERGARWRGWDAQGEPLDPADFPGARAMRGERVVPGREMLFTDDADREIWTSIATVPIRDGDGRVTGQICTISDIDALKRVNDALRDSEERFRQFSDASTNVLWIRDAETLRMTFASPAYETIYGIPGPDRGGDGSLRAWAERIEPENRKAVLENFRHVRAGKRIEQEFQIRRASDGALRWVHNTDFPLRNAAGKVRWVAGLGADITDVKEATDRQGVLVAELQHRTRNLIAVVRSLSDRTLGEAASLDDFGKRFRPRLAALSRVQGLLSHLAVGERVTFKELLCSELAAHGATDGLSNKLTLEGPADVPLRSATVQTFALALHELATNAVKYGALAAPDGHLTVRWRVEAASGADPPRLHVEWREAGVVMPHVGAAPRGGGYGRELIERALPYQLKAKTSYELGTDGVRCTIAVPISRKESEGFGDE